jgi:hypothetical protein
MRLKACKRLPSAGGARRSLLTRRPGGPTPSQLLPDHHNNLLEVHRMKTLTKPALSAFEGGRK